MELFRDIDISSNFVEDREIFIILICNIHTCLPTSSLFGKVLMECNLYPEKGTHADRKYKLNEFSQSKHTHVTSFQIIKK